MPIQERLGVNALATMNMNFDGDGKYEYDALVNELVGIGS